MLSPMGGVNRIITNYELENKQLKLEIIRLRVENEKLKAAAQEGTGK
jgi:hypothetical protein